MFFRKKQKVDLDAKFKEVYREVNKITAECWKGIRCVQSNIHN